MVLIAHAAVEYRSFTSFVSLSPRSLQFSLASLWCSRRPWTTWWISTTGRPSRTPCCPLCLAPTLVRWMNVCKDWWMDGDERWMVSDGCVDGWIGEWLDRFKDRLTNERLNGWMIDSIRNGWINIWLVEWMNGWMDGLMDRLMDGWMIHRLINAQMDGWMNG